MVIQIVAVIGAAVAYYNYKNGGEERALDSPYYVDRGESALIRFYGFENLKDARSWTAYVTQTCMHRLNGQLGDKKAIRLSRKSCGKQNVIYFDQTIRKVCSGRAMRAFSGRSSN